MKRKAATLVAILAGFSGMETPLKAAVVYEGFDYTAGVNLNGENGGTGFSAGWSAGTTEPYHTITSAGLDFPGLDTSGRAISGGIDGDQMTRSLSTPFAGTDGTTTWMSYLLHVTSLDSASYATMFYKSPGVFGLTYGQFGVFAKDSKQYFGLGTSSGSATLFLTEEVAPNTTYLIVGSIEWNSSGNETMSLYVNPTLGTTPSTPTLRADYGLTAGIVKVILKSNELSSGWTYDEIRLGDSYAEVSPVPEPGTTALLLIAVGALGLVRRRRSEISAGSSNPPYHHG